MELKTQDARLHLTNGNYQSLVKARKPYGIEDKTATIIGGGIGGLSTACFLVRDAHMDGSKIKVLEELTLSGGAMDGRYINELGYVARGGRETGHHFEVLWDLYSSIPTIDDPNVSILDSYFYTNYDDPNFSNCRITHNCGERYDNGKFNLSEEASKALVKLVLTKDEDLEGKAMNEVLPQSVFDSDFWIYWRTMFAFQEWDSALEMKLYMNRFIHHIDGLPDLSALQFTRYDQYESIIKPMVKYLKDHGVQFEYGITVSNVEFDISDSKKVAKRIIARNANNEEVTYDLSENDLVFITNGSMTENSGYGSTTTPAPFYKEDGNCFKMWKNIAAQCDEFGHPEVFSDNVELTNWESCTVTCHTDLVPKYIEKITKRTPYGGKTCTGGIVTAKDSNWLMSWTINRQGQYKQQPANDICVWVYSLFTDRDGDYIKKPMRDCTGEEIIKEWLYHIGVPTTEIDEAASTCTAVPVMMPYITSQFMPRSTGDRPLVVPHDAVNFAFIGQFAETMDLPQRDTVFTQEYSGRCAMEAVYILCGVDRGVPEVYASRYDIRYLLTAALKLNDGKVPSLDINPIAKRKIHKKIEGTEIEEILKECGIIQ